MEQGGLYRRILVSRRHVAVSLLARRLPEVVGLGGGRGVGAGRAVGDGHRMQMGIVAPGVRGDRSTADLRRDRVGHIVGPSYWVSGGAAGTPCIC